MHGQQDITFIYVLVLTLSSLLRLCLLCGVLHSCDEIKILYDLTFKDTVSGQ